MEYQNKSSMKYPQSHANNSITKHIKSAKIK